MRRTTLVILAITCILTGCISTPTNDTYTPEAVEVRPGVYVANDASALSLPTEGYDIYVIGEEHGVHESNILFLEYLKTLHEQIGLRDIILEAPSYEEEKVNEYLCGATSTLPSDSRNAFFEILPAVREFNKTLPEDEKIRVHFVEADNIAWVVHMHLQALKKEIGVSARNIEIPALDEFREWSEEDMMRVVDHLIEVAESNAVLHELEMVETSIRRLFVKSGKAEIRESIITQNIQYVLGELDGAPVLALYGYWHAQKSQGAFGGYHIRPWAQRLMESGISVYSVSATGIKGEKWDFYSSTRSTVICKDPNQIVFADSTTLGDIFDGNPDYDIVYVDLLREENASVRTSGDLGGIINVPSHTLVREFFDGLVVFREVSPEVKPKELEK